MKKIEFFFPFTNYISSSFMFLQKIVRCLCSCSLLILYLVLKVDVTGCSSTIDFVSFINLRICQIGERKLIKYWDTAARLLKFFVCPLDKARLKRNKVMRLVDFVSCSPHYAFVGRNCLIQFSSH